MEIEFTAKIKSKHKPPVFDKRLGKGVVAKITIEFKGVKSKDLKNKPLLLKNIFEKRDEILNDFFEVKIKEIKKKKGAK